VASESARAAEAKAPKRQATIFLESPEGDSASSDDGSAAIKEGIGWRIMCMRDCEMQIELKYSLDMCKRLIFCCTGHFLWPVYRTNKLEEAGRICEGKKKKGSKRVFFPPWRALLYSNYCTGLGSAPMKCGLFGP
jgi:hypothetical protein